MSANRDRRTRMSRRGFLKTAGSMAGALITAPLLLEVSDAAAAPRSFARTSNSLRIGVLLPHSQLYPALAGSLLGGLQLYFHQRNGQKIEWLTNNYGVLPSNASDSIRKLILGDQVNMLVGVVSSAAVSPIRDLLKERQIPLIVNNAGANFLRSFGESPYVFRNTLNYWRASWTSGAWAAKSLGVTAFVAASFYESGYDTLYAFRRGFEAAGGVIRQTRITHRPAAGVDWTALMAEIKRANPKLVYAAYSGQSAVDFAQAYAKSGLAGRIPLVGTGFMADEPLLAAPGSVALDMTSSLSWSSSLTTPENRAFMLAYQRRTGHAADAFAALGYDTARLITEALNLAGDRRDGDRLRQALGAVEFTGPRGPIKMDQLTRTVNSSLYLRQTARGGRGPGSTLLTALGSRPLLDEQNDAVRSSPKTGWRNAYLCI
jgi:branched-chain amino acid transport system substrate-binding protein